MVYFGVCECVCGSTVEVNRVDVSGDDTQWLRDRTRYRGTLAHLERLLWWTHQCRAPLATMNVIDDVYATKHDAVFGSPVWESLFSKQEDNANSKGADDVGVLIKEIWKKYDADGNGVLDSDEIRNLCRGYLRSIPEIQALKARMDVRVWAHALNDFSKLITTKLMIEVDENSDGFIDFEEFNSSFWKVMGRDKHLSPRSARNNCGCFKRTNEFKFASQKDHGVS